MTGAEGKARVGVVGLGYFGSHHARHYAAHPGAELIAVVDADPERAGIAAQNHQAEALADHKALIGKVDAVSITVPTSLHHAVARDLIEAGLHVFVEKPIAAEVDEAADLVARAHRQGVTLQVGHIERHSPAFAALRERVRAPRLIECVRQNPWNGRATDVDVVLDLMIHDIDLALTLAGSPVESVAATGVRVATATSDAAEARLTFASGAVANLSASRVAATGRRTVTVVEPGRCLTADLANQTVSITVGEGGAVDTETVSLTPADNLATEIDAFLHSVRTGNRPLVDGRAGLDALKVADMILAAISNRRVATPQPTEGVPA